MFLTLCRWNNCRHSWGGQLKTLLNFILFSTQMQGYRKYHSKRRNVLDLIDNCRVIVFRLRHFNRHNLTEKFISHSWEGGWIVAVIPSSFDEEQKRTQSPEFAFPLIVNQTTVQQSVYEVNLKEKRVLDVCRGAMVKGENFQRGGRGFEPWCRIQKCKRLLKKDNK